MSQPSERLLRYMRRLGLPAPTMCVPLSGTLAVSAERSGAPCLCLALAAGGEQAEAEAAEAERVDAEALSGGPLWLVAIAEVAADAEDEAAADANADPAPGDEPGDERTQGICIDVLAAEPLRYHRGRLSDELVVGEHALGVPIGRGDEVLQALALARLARDHGGVSASAPAPLVDALCDPITAPAAAWLAASVGPERELCAWLETVTQVTIDSPVLGQTSVSQYFVMTSERAGLVAISAAGEVQFQALDGDALMEVSSSLGRRQVRVGEASFRATLRNGASFEALAPLYPRGRFERLLGLARLRWERRERDGLDAARAGALAILAPACAAHQPQAVLSATWVSPEQPQRDSDAAARALAELGEYTPSSAVLVAWAEEWGLDDERALALIDQLVGMATGPERAAWALPFHRWLHDRLLAAASDQASATDIDLALAEHLALAEAHDDLVALAEARLQKLPPAEFDELLPPRPLAERSGEPDGEAGEAGLAGSARRTPRVRLVELLAHARTGGRGLDRDTLYQLARLQPLVPAHLTAVIAHLGEGAGSTAADSAGGEADSAAADSAVGEAADSAAVDAGVVVAAASIQAVLEPGGLAPASAPFEEPGRVRPLSDATLETIIRHPATRQGGVLASLQTLLAKVEVPDRGLLRSHCEHISPARHAAAAVALQDAAVALGVPGIDGYISHGEKAIGARAYEGRPAFLLLGAEHLEPGSMYAMSPGELCFTIAAEVAHVRFQHARVTAEDVWTGAWQTGQAGLDLALKAVPLMRGIKLVDRLHDLIEVSRLSLVGEVVDGAAGSLKGALGRLRGRHGKSALSRDSIAPAGEELIAAHRAMQLTADRAGLVLCGDLHSAVRAIFLARSDYRAELAIAERYGLAEVLTRHTGDAAIGFQDLAVRVAALASFSLTAEYRAARAALCGAPS